jgi:hypothetical protein
MDGDDEVHRLVEGAGCRDRPRAERADANESLNAAIDSRPEAVSTEVRVATCSCGIVIYGREVRLFEVGMFIENLVFGHSRAKPPEHIPDGNTQSADAGLSPSFSGLDRDSGTHW